jgi:hypothetical protein
MVADGREVLLRIVLRLLLVLMLATFSFCAAVSLSADDSIWNAAFGGLENDVARCVQQTSDGGYIVAGWTTSFGQGNADVWLVKVNASGSMVWNKTIGGAGNDEAYCVQATNDGGYVIAGCTESSGAGLSDFWLIKTDGSGAVSWDREYGGAHDDFAFCVRQTSDGGYVVVGYTESFGAGSSDYWLVKTDGYGSMMWNQTYGGVGLDQAFCVVQNSNGGYAMAGQTDSLGAGNSDFWLVCTDSWGSVVWSRAFGGSNVDVARSIQETSDGGYVVAGWTASFGAGSDDYMLLKVDDEGRQQWSKTFGDLYSDEAYAVQQTADGGYMIAGSTMSYGLGGWDFWQVKTDANGNKLWDQPNGGILDDQAYSVQQTSDEGFVVAGSTLSYGEGLADFWVTKNMPRPPRPPENDHDVAIVGVSPSRVVLGEGSTLIISVTVANLGKYSETTLVSVYANATLVDAYPLLIMVGHTESFDFAWNTSGFVKTTYELKAVAAPVLGETDTARANNTYDDGEVTVTTMGDVQGDMRIDCLDVFSLGRAYSSDPSKPNWNLYCDFNDDGHVDSADLQLLSQNFGETSG